MARNIIILSDGTGNSASKLQKTNVWRLYDALDLSGSDQIAEYDDGVGTSSLRPLAMIGSGFGIGLAQNVRRLYGFISRNYRGDDDRLFAFGFSRGSFTIRMLIGLVRNQGLVPRDLPEDAFRREIVRRYTAYRKARFQYLRTFRAEPEQVDPNDVDGILPEFEFVGLWDTVGAYGLPIDELQHGIDLLIYPLSLPSRKFSRYVKCAYHALSLDDERRTFHPVLWDEIDVNGDELPAERLQQVWFPGMHANVGGGYPKDGLAYVSLEWMIGKAQAHGLRFLPSHVHEIQGQADAHDQLYNSRAGIGGYYRYAPRPVTALGNDHLNGVTIRRPKVHESAFARIEGERVDYAPITIPPVYDLVMRDGTIVPWEQNVPGGASVNHFRETPEQAQVRGTIMESTWNVAWGRRIIYFATLIATLFLAALPWTGPTLSTQAKWPEVTQLLGEYLRPPLKMVSYLVPNWVTETWLTAFGKEPVLFLLSTLAVGLTMMIGLRQEAIIHSRANEIWCGRWAGPDPRNTLIYKLRTNPTLVRAYRHFAWEILPILFIFACAIVLLAVALTHPQAWVYYGLIVLAIWFHNWIGRDDYQERIRKRTGKANSGIT